MSWPRVPQFCVVLLAIGLGLGCQPDPLVLDPPNPDNRPATQQRIEAEAASLAWQNEEQEDIRQIVRTFGNIDMPQAEILVMKIDGAGGRGDPRVPTADGQGFLHDRRHFYGYRILAEAIPQSADETGAVVSVVTSPATYGGNPALCFDPGLGISLRTPTRSADLVICTECSRAQLYDNEQYVRELTLSPQGETSFNKLYQRWFPNEEQVSPAN